ncbi:MAG TPA: ABC transporter permease subunit [Paraburkholderia sp.]|nr:ABC transporter permease subunit [Paraburkholderia sp.]
MSVKTEYLPPHTLSERRQRRRLPAIRYRRAVSPLAVLLAWQIACWSGWVSTRIIPAPITIAETFWSMTVSGELERNLLVSLGRAASGLAIGVTIGVVAALIAGLSKAGEDAIDPPMQMMRTLPHLALVPLFILWFGIGEAPKIALVALGTAFPIYLNLYAGIRGVDPKVIEAMTTVGLTRTEMIWHIVLPGALPSALVGLRYAIGVAWLSLVVGEQVNASSGIGYLVMNAREFVRTDIIFVGLIVYSLLGLAADMLVRKLEAAALVWRPAPQKR